MKRSRTCQCLVELDDTPKRTRSTPDLGALRRLGALRGHQQQTYYQKDLSRGRHHFDLDSALRVLRQAVSTPAAVKAPTAVPGASSAGGGFVVESIVRSKGSLNEVTILEHEQFIGEESGDFGGGRDGGPCIVEDGGSMAAHGSRGGLLFRETLPGSLFEDSGDSSDYFCGVASSDEAEEVDEDTRNAGVDGMRDPCHVTVGLGETVAAGNSLIVTPNGSDTDDAISNTSSGRGGGSSCDDMESSSVNGGLAVQQPSSLHPTWQKAHHHFGYGDGYRGLVCNTSPPQSLACNAWRPASSSACPRVTVRIRSPSGSAAAVATSIAPTTPHSSLSPQECQQRETVSPPWPAVVPVGTAWRDDDDASCDMGPLVPPCQEESKVLLGLGRLRLAEAKAPIVEVGPETMWKCHGSPLGGAEGEDPALESRGLA